MRPKSKVEALDAHPRTVLFGLLTVSSLVIATWFGYEEYLLAKNEPPITWYTRRLVNKYWAVGRVIEALAMFIIGVAFCHFVIDSDQQPPSK